MYEHVTALFTINALLKSHLSGYKIMKSCCAVSCFNKYLKDSEIHFCRFPIEKELDCNSGVENPGN